MSELTPSERLENQQAELPGDGPKVLVAEDEPGIRKLLHFLLKMWGYRALVASNGKEAIAVADRQPDPIDLLLTDVTMPGMGGPELAENLTKKRPSLKVVLMSGYSHVQLALSRGWVFLQKPFKPAEVKDIIKKVL